MVACSAVIDGKSESGSMLAAAYCFRGRVYAFTRDLDRAMADFRKALEISPGLRSASESLQRLGAVQ
jgi:hypothetical protein